MNITITLSDLSPELRAALGGADHISFAAVDKDERTILRDEFVCGKEAAFLAVTAADYARGALAKAAGTEKEPAARQKPAEPSGKGAAEPGDFKPGDCVEVAYLGRWARGSFLGYDAGNGKWCRVLMDRPEDTFALTVPCMLVRRCV